MIKEKFCKMCGNDEGPFHKDRWRCLECHVKYERARWAKNKDKHQEYNQTEKRKEKQLERANKWYENHTEDVLESRKEHYEINQDRLNIERKCKKYNITEDKYKEMIGKNCEICGKRKWKMCIDHCHKTNKVRGILCNECNSGIGFLKDDSKLLQNAINYLSGIEKSNFEVKNGLICSR